MTTSIVLGLGGCLDSELAVDPEGLQDLVDAHCLEMSQIAQPERLDTERDVLISVLAYLREGIGGERYVNSVDALRAMEARFPHEVTLGGTNVRAGRALAKLGHPNLLHVPGRDRTFESLLVEESIVPPSTPEASYVPHLIVQFPQGVRLRLVDGEITAPHANRVILVHDPVSELTPLHADLPSWLEPGGVLVISGLNSIRSQQILEERLDTLRALIDQAPNGLRVLYEDAEYHVPQFRRRVWEALVPRVSAVSMNEDELAGLVGRLVDVTRAEEIAVAVDEVLQQLSDAPLVVHSKHWALAAGARSRELGSALELGIEAAGARFLAGDASNANALERVRAAAPSSIGEEIAAHLPPLLRAAVAVRSARTLVTPAPTTIGLGDTFLGGMIAGIVEAHALLPIGESQHSPLEVV